MSQPTTTNRPSTLRALPAFGLAAAGAVLAASAWATQLPEEGFMFDPRLWQEEVAGDEEGWYQLTLATDAVQVRAAERPPCGEAAAEDALYVQMPGITLHEGTRVNYLFGRAAFRPVVGQRYPLALGKTDVAFTVESSAAGTQYTIEYGGVKHDYLLGLPAAATRVHAVVDLDGDRQPDFLVEVGDALFLLLSSHAKSGTNLPSAQLWAAR